MDFLNIIFISVSILIISQFFYEYRFILYVISSMHHDFSFFFKGFYHQMIIFPD